MYTIETSRRYDKAQPWRPNTDATPDEKNEYHVVQFVGIFLPITFPKDTLNSLWFMPSFSSAGLLVIIVNFLAIFTDKGQCSEHLDKTAQ